ncbi:MAG TPA: Mpo1-like protein, partial [bacterium]|nr:Mpo1-like protein [bacterium]
AVVRLFAAYGAVHAAPGNRACHWVGIPMIYLGAAGALARASTPLMAAVVAAMMVAWLVLEWRLAILAILVSPVVLLGAMVLPLVPALLVFAAGFGISVAGHVVFEKGGPKSLREGAAGTFVAPLWLLNLAVGLVPESDPSLR